MVRRGYHLHMSESPPNRADREAQRSVIVDALGDLANAPDPHRAASDVMRAIDAYIDSAPTTTAPSRESPVTDYERREIREARSITWIVVGCAVLATLVVSVLLSGGWVGALAIGGIWAVALFALMSS
jgi:hypothetical protein